MTGAIIYQLGEHRAARRGDPPATANPQTPDWALLAERADTILTAADAAIRASSHQRPGLYALRDEVAGLRGALRGMSLQRAAVESIWDEAYDRGRQER